MKLRAGISLYGLLIISLTFAGCNIFSSLAGDPDEGFALLDQAVSARAREVIFVQVSQMLGGHRDDPRYEALIRAVGFE